MLKRSLLSICQTTIRLNHVLFFQRLVERGQFRLLVGRLRSETGHGKILMAVDSSEASRRSRASLNVRSDGEDCPSASTAPTTKTRGRKKTGNSPTGGMVLRGKENSAQALGSPPRRRTKSSAERVEVCISSSHESPTVVMDEDSNEIYPVGQFFGNLDHLPVRNSFTPCYVLSVSVNSFLLYPQTLFTWQIRIDTLLKWS